MMQYTHAEVTANKIQIWAMSAGYVAEFNISTHPLNEVQTAVVSHV